MQAELETANVMEGGWVGAELVVINEGMDSNLRRVCRALLQLKRQS